MKLFENGGGGKKKRLTFKIIILIVIILFFIELFSTIILAPARERHHWPNENFVPNKTHGRFVPKDATLYYNDTMKTYNPNDACYGNLTVSYNRYGMRKTYNPTQEKLEGRIRICFVGSMNTQNYWSSDGNNYYDLIEKDLISKGYDVEVLPIGVAGFSPIGTVMLYKEACEPFHPDILIWQYYYKDPIVGKHRLVEISSKTLQVRKPFFIDNEIEYKYITLIPEILPLSSIRLVNIIFGRIRMDIRGHDADLVQYYDEGVETTRQILREFKPEHNYPSFAFSVPMNYTSLDTSWIFNEEENGFKFIETPLDTTPHTDYCKPEYNYPNKNGHKKIFEHLIGPIEEVVIRIAEKN